MNKTGSNLNVSFFPFMKMFVQTNGTLCSGNYLGLLDYHKTSDDKWKPFKYRILAVESFDGKHQRSNWKKTSSQSYGKRNEVQF